MRTHLVPLALLAPLVVAAWQCGGTTAPVSGDGGTSNHDGSVGGDDGGGGGDAGGGGDGSGGCTCQQGRICCSGQCINPDNDPKNCGTCGVVCSGSTPYCDGSCKPAPCSPGGPTCIGTQTCCGNQCCDATQICCKDDGPIGNTSSCFTPTPQAPTCPQGCAPQCKSDRDAKRDIEPVDERAILEGVARMPVSSWSYKTEDPSVRHVGPMAQDFHAEFGLGASDRSYDAIDAHGIAFAAIKALYDQVQEQNARIEKLERENRQCRSASP